MASGSSAGVGVPDKLPVTPTPESAHIRHIAIKAYDAIPPIPINHQTCRSKPRHKYAKTPTASAGPMSPSGIARLNGFIVEGAPM